MAGARAFVAVDNNFYSHELITMTNDPTYPATEVTIPCMFISGIDAQILLPTLERNIARISVKIEFARRSETIDSLNRLATHINRSNSNPKPLQQIELPMSFNIPSESTSETQPIGVVVVEAQPPS